jgi:undecaprenyl-diphosphatase
MTFWESVLLGIVQGLTEYLPISSTAHLRIVPALLGWPDPGAAYTAVIQLGTLLAVLVYFRNDLMKLGAGSARDLSARNWSGHDLRMTLAILSGTLPIGALGLLFKHQIENDLRSLNVIATALIALAVVLALAEKVGKRERGAESLTFWDIQFIGAAQALALIPGASRSGATLTAALLIGMRRDEAARFSFLLGIPAVTAAGLFELKDLIELGLDSNGLWLLVVGTSAAFVSGFAAIEVLLRFLKTRSTLVFIVYRIVLGLAIFGLLHRGILTP